MKDGSFTLTARLKTQLSNLLDEHERLLKSANRQEVYVAIVVPWSLLLLASFAGPQIVRG